MAVKGSLEKWLFKRQRIERTFPAAMEAVGRVLMNNKIDCTVTELSRAIVVGLGFKHKWPAKDN